MRLIPVQKRNAVERKGFTLIELLVSMAVLSLMLGLLLQITGGTGSAILASDKKIDAATQARVALEAVGNDFANLIAERGLTLLAKPGAQGIEFALLAKGRGPTSDSRCVSVTYSLQPTGLVRTSSSILWNQTDWIAAITDTNITGSAETLATGIIRLEASAILDDGRVVAIAEDTGWNLKKIDGEAIPGGYLGINLRKSPLIANHARAIIVTVAALDEAGMQLLASTNGVATLRGKLPPAADGKSTIDQWEKAVSSGQLSDFPPQIRSALSFAQRTFALR